MNVSLFDVRRNLQAKLIVIILLTVGIFTTIFILYAMQETRRVINNQTEAYGNTLAHGVAHTCIQSDEFLQGNYNALQKTLNIIGRSYSNIRAIEILIENTIVAKYSAIDRGKGNDPQKLISEKGVSYEAPLEIFVNGTQLIVIGTVRVICSPDKYFQVFVQQMNASLFYGIILLTVISALLYLLLNYLIVQPITSIEKGAKIIGKGNLSYQISVPNNDEIGRLAAAFNMMTANLKTSKDEIEEWNRTLEQKVKQRTAALRAAHEKLKETQYQLVQSGKMAAIGLVGAGVAHELNNPLCCIIGYIQIMLNKLRGKSYSVDDAHKFEKYLTTIEKESKRCEGIVANLLQYSKESKEKIEEVRIKEVIDATMMVMEYQMHKWKIEPNIALVKDDIIVLGSGDKLQQVFINFIANAHNAMPDGGTITISNEIKNADQGQEVWIAVKDTGCGIPRENLGKLFGSFFSTKDKSKTNLGLGLSISNQIVKNHKGRIQVDSEIGVGTTFCVILPIHKSIGER